MTEWGDQIRFPLEPSPGVGVTAVGVVQQLDGIGSGQPGVLGLVHLTHPAAAEQLQNLIATDVGTDRHAHLMPFQLSPTVGELSR